MSCDRTARAAVIFQSYLAFLRDGLGFVSSYEVKAASQEVLRQVAKNGFQLCFQKLYERWQNCIVTQQDYFEGKHRRLREGRESVEDVKSSGCQKIFHAIENIEKFSAAICKNWLQTIAESVGISPATCQQTPTKDLNMHWMHQHIVPRMLNEDQSADEVKSASQAELND
ncbi:uncharacterized protein TNCV_1491511 [Trichonephila clavipes]|nr:uncharacterized protein TNCV_1491511 [Trichonephila clavipes]